MRDQGGGEGCSQMCSESNEVERGLTAYVGTRSIPEKLREARRTLGDDGVVG